MVTSRNSLVRAQYAGESTDLTLEMHTTPRHGAYFKYNTLHLAYGFVITRENSPFKNMWIDVKGHPLLLFNE